MAGFALAGDTSGQLVVNAPAVAGTNTLTLQAATATNAVNTLGTAVATTSGTSIDFTGLPAWVKRITVMYSGLSTSGTSSLLIQIGPSGAVETTGYLSTGGVTTGTGVAHVSSTAGFIIFQDNASYTTQGIATIINITSNTWVYSQAGRLTSTNNTLASGDKTVASTLTRVRLTTVNGTDTFDAGSVNILYEG